MDEATAAAADEWGCPAAGLPCRAGTGDFSVQAAVVGRATRLLSAVTDVSRPRPSPAVL